MKIYRPQNVLEAALARIRWLFTEFPNVVCNVSGGKDSTVVFHLCLQVAREQHRLPLPVLFIDQEAEWEATIAQIRAIMYHPEVKPLWFQIPIRLSNATSVTDHWLHCWDPAEEHRWVRPRDPIAIQANRYGTDRFKPLFGAIIAKEFPAIKTCQIAGVRCEESPSRTLGLTSYPTYKGETWGRITKKGLHYTMYPIYDWSYTDVWKAIHTHGWPYCRIYDLMYQYGVAVQDMRVSNVHHETAVTHLFRLQELEPETYERIVARIGGIDMAGKLGKTDYFVKELPPMFRSWQEYRDYLLEKLITNPDWRTRFRTTFAEQEREFAETKGDRLYQAHITAILTNDWEGTKLENLRVRWTSKATRLGRQPRPAGQACREPVESAGPEPGRGEAV